MKVPEKKKIVVSVISDLVTDQRVQKECNTLFDAGYEILLLGRNSERSFGLNALPYPTKRLKVPFKRGPLMYLWFNLRLLIRLMFTKADIYWANDLDTLLPNYLASRLKGKQLIYDSHEYFTLTVYKALSRKVWSLLEKALFPKLKNVITVNESIRNVYEQKYHVPITVIRNVPYKSKQVLPAELEVSHRDKKILVIQGIGINEHRGAEEAVEMMQYLPDEFLLYFLGSGTVIPKLKHMTAELGLGSRIFFLGVLPYQEMLGYTEKCYAGLIVENIHFNDAHRFSLPNRFFDYIKAHIPVISTEVTDIKIIIDKYNIGAFFKDVVPKNMAQTILQIGADKEVYETWKRNTIIASNELCWENEQRVLLNFMETLR